MNKIEKKKWTLMFFFASDNNLSPSMLYQLKSIKTAGFQLDTNVLVHFDPNERGAPTRFFEVNKNERVGHSHSRIGDERDPIVRDLAGDSIDPAVIKKGLGLGRESVPRPGGSDDENAERALANFLTSCHKLYPAEQYMLFLVGHGLVVGRDKFLPDDNPSSAITLVKLGEILRSFSEEIASHGVLELIGMHSCSMSAIEVAYELRGTAKYMMASEGISFVGTWPYRQMLQKIFSAIENSNGEKVKVPELMENLHELCLHNSADFVFAGYSADLCLCSLEKERVEALKEPIQNLSAALKAGLADARGKELILLAHLESQSYFQEVYSDLYDFCDCLREKCKNDRERNAVMEAMSVACDEVINKLKPSDSEKSDGPVLYADFFGPDFQYSHGLSIYFPWSRPVEDANEAFLEAYKQYAFETELSGEDLSGESWLKFLDCYFKATERPQQPLPLSDSNSRAALKTVEAIVRTGQQNGSAAFVSSALTGKVSPPDSGGSGNFISIKNYSRKFSLSERALKVFAPEAKPTTPKSYQDPDCASPVSRGRVAESNT